MLISFGGGGVSRVTDRALQILQSALGWKQGGLPSNRLQWQPTQPGILYRLPSRRDNGCITGGDTVSSSDDGKPLVIITLAQCRIADTFGNSDIWVV